MKWFKDNAIQLVGVALLAGAFWVTTEIQGKLRGYLTIEEADKRTKSRDIQLSQIAADIEVVRAKQSKIWDDVIVIRFQTQEMYTWFVRQRTLGALTSTAVNGVMATNPR